MRASIIIACLILCGCVNSINAQWYSKKYGVENLNDLSDEQLIKSYSHARASSIVGGVAAGTGIVLMSIGLEIAVQDFMKPSSILPPPPKGLQWVAF